MVRSVFCGRRLPQKLPPALPPQLKTIQFTAEDPAATLQPRLTCTFVALISSSIATLCLLAIFACLRHTSSVGDCATKVSPNLLMPSFPLTCHLQFRLFPCVSIHFLRLMHGAGVARVLMATLIHSLGSFLDRK